MSDVIRAVQAVEDNPDTPQQWVMVACGTTLESVVIAHSDGITDSEYEHILVNVASVNVTYAIGITEPGLYRVPVTPEYTHSAVISYGEPQPCSWPIGNTEHTYKSRLLKQEAETLRLRKERDDRAAYLEEVASRGVKTLREVLKRLQDTEGVSTADLDAIGFTGLYKELRCIGNVPRPKEG